MQDRSLRQRLASPEAQTLQAAVDNRGRGWQYDRRTGDAHMVVRPLGGTDPYVGCIAYVRPKPSGKGYESIVKGGRVTGYPGEWESATEALTGVEEWLQRGLMGLKASDAASTEIERTIGWIREQFGDQAEEMRRNYVMYLASQQK